MISSTQFNYLNPSEQSLYKRYPKQPKYTKDSEYKDIEKNSGSLGFASDVVNLAGGATSIVQSFRNMKAMDDELDLKQANLFNSATTSNNTLARYKNDQDLQGRISSSLSGSTNDAAVKAGKERATRMFEGINNVKTTM